MTLMQDTEIPFGHPGRNFDDFDDRYEPPPLDPPEEAIVHYGPGDRPLCGDESPYAVYTDQPDQVVGCEECLELVAEDLQDPDTRYGGYCLHCRLSEPEVNTVCRSSGREITATGSVEWRRVVRRPCPHCGKPGW